MIYGSIVASYCCEGFGVTATTRATRAGIEKRRRTLERIDSPAATLRRTKSSSVTGRQTFIG
jgi:hypothetical protein